MKIKVKEKKRSEKIRTLVGSPTVIPITKHEMHSPSNFNILVLDFTKIFFWYRKIKIRNLLPVSSFYGQNDRKMIDF